MNSKHIVSWDTYIASLMEKGYASGAAICTIKDGKRYATSPGFDITPEEVSAIAAGFEDGGTKLRHEMYVGCKKYTLTRVDNTLMVGRVCATGSGCVIYRCAKCFVIGTYDNSACAGGCYSVVRRMGDFLRCLRY